MGDLQEQDEFPQAPKGQDFKQFENKKPHKRLTKI